MNEGSLIGQLVSGRFHVVSLLGVGGMSEVYLAEHRVLGRRFAVKVIKECIQNDPVLVERFHREARVVSRLDHPNIVSITDFGRLDDGRFFLLMEHIEGKNLRDTIQHASPNRLPLERSTHILLQLTNALSVAHEAGIIHRDLKPENILLKPTRTQEDYVKVLDFGIAKIMDTGEMQKLTSKGEIFGTPSYLSPEQSMGEEVDERTDLYSLGVIMFELFAGRLPFTHKAIPLLLIAHQEEKPPWPSDLIPPGETPIPAELESLTMACLAKNPADRPAAARLVAQMLDSNLRKMRQARLDTDLTRMKRQNLAAQKLACDTLMRDPRFKAVGSPASEAAAFCTEEQERIHHEMQAAAWSGAVKNARYIGEIMSDLGICSADLTKMVESLKQVEEQLLSIETEVALAESRLDDFNASMREAESQLHYAIIDLSIERGRSLDGTPDPANIADLNFQISELDSRLAELYSIRAAKQTGLIDAIEKRRGSIEFYRGRQNELESSLVRMAISAKPEHCPVELRRAYDNLQSLLSKL